MNLENIIPLIILYTLPLLYIAHVLIIHDSPGIIALAGSHMNAAPAHSYPQATCHSSCPMTHPGSVGTANSAPFLVVKKSSANRITRFVILGLNPLWGGEYFCSAMSVFEAFYRSFDLDGIDGNRSSGYYISQKEYVAKQQYQENKAPIHLRMH